MRIAVATCARLPELDVDERLLLGALRDRGAEAIPAIWTDERVAWESFDLVAIRCTWDYVAQRAAFVAWAQRVSERTALANPASVIAWNTHKGYLRELEARAVPVVPTAWAARGERVDLDAILDARGWDVAVVKPAVSAGARDTMRVTRASRGQARDLLAQILESRDAMIQPYLPTVEGYGERSLLFAGGAYSHTIRKHALLAPGAPSREDQGEGVQAVEATPQELALARRVLDEAQRATGGSLAYARVDVAPRSDGAGPVLMELEATEPRLFLRSDSAAPGRFASAFLDAAYAAQRRGP